MAPHNIRPGGHGLGFGLINDWEQQAACKDTPISLWFGDERQLGDKGPIRTREQVEQAKAICVRCPVLDDCRRWAMESRIPHGLIGMMTERERKGLWDKSEAALPASMS
jgi:WhiB family redox-sensing transcriptional regulator